jgi:MoxR-like ATPase
MRKAAMSVYIDDSIYDYILRLSRSTRQNEWIKQGASPRCTLALAALSQASAYLFGRDFVVPGDVQGVFTSCVSHRLVMSPKARADGHTQESVLRQILESTPAPSITGK